MLRWLGLGLLTVVTIGGIWLYFALNSRTTAVDQDALCYIGAYAFADNTHAIVVAYDNGATLEFFLPDGARGLMSRVSAGEFSGEGIRFARPDCASLDATIHRQNGTVSSVRKVAFRERDTRFKNSGVELAGKLVAPLHGPARQVVVWVAGSNDDGEIDRTHWQYTLPLQGIASFMLDKRGTGGSLGSVSANFHVRAGDVRAAVAEVRRLMGSSVEIGLHGASQGGWVAPLAALHSDVDFVIVSYGLAEGVTAEDRDEMAAYVRKAGYGPDTLAKLRQLTDITAKIVRSHWRDGWNGLATWSAEHGDEPWVASLPSTSYTGVLLQIPSFAAGTIGPIIGPMLDKGISFDYDPRPTLATLKAPQLWLLGGADVSAPSAATIEVLRDLKAKGAPIELVIFPNAGHGLMEPWPGHDAERLAPGYREAVANWAKTHPTTTPCVARNSDTSICKLGRVRD